MTWAQYFTIVTILTGMYYAVVVVIYYRDNVKSSFEKDVQEGR